MRSPGDPVVEGLRQALSGTIERLMTDGAEPLPTEPDPSDPGPIPLDSPVREVHRDASGFIGGVRALLYQTLHPDACFVVHRHSVYDEDPLGRLRRTAGFLGATIFGGDAAAGAAIARVNHIHSRLRGTLPDGRPYRADDPHLIGWVHATEVDSFLAAYQRYGSRRLSPGEADRYVADMRVVGERLGGIDLPGSRAELASTLAAYRTECRASDECRDLTRFIFAPGLPLPALSFYPVVFAGAVASLPEWARRMLLLPVPPFATPLVIRPATSALVRTLRWASPR